MIVPQAEPVQPAPATVQLTAGFAVLPTVAVNVLVALTSSVTVAGESATVIAASTVTAAAAVLVGSAWLVAVTVTAAGDGTAEGAVYRPLEIVPQADPVQPAPESVQLTAVLLVPPTVAANGWARVTFTLAAGGATPMVTGVMVTVAAPDLLGSSCEVAVTVTVLGEGAEVGAV